MKKVCLGVVCARTILVKTAASIIKTIRNTDIPVIFQNGVYIHSNRNIIIDKAKELGHTHVFFVDHDVVFEGDTLDRLLEHDKDIITANYNQRYLPSIPTVKGEFKESEIFKCEYIPMGCTLINLSVYDKLEKPYYFYEHDKEGKLVTSEDYYFCNNAKKEGFTLWCDPTIKVEHIGDYHY